MQRLYYNSFSLSTVGHYLSVNGQINSQKMPLDTSEGIFCVLANYLYDKI